jgi:hypothetical protein
LGESGKKTTLDSPGDFAFGDLNPLFKSIIRNTIPLPGVSVDPGALIRKSVAGFLEPDHLKGTGPYKAIVLRVEKYPKGGSWSFDPNSKEFELGVDAPDLIKIKARIPELHSSLPIPDAFGDTDGEHQPVIDLYHTFTAQSDNVPEPECGEIVWVDFIDKNTLSGPIYIRPLLEREKFINFIKKITASGAFAQPCGEFSSTTSGGDSVVAHSDPLALAGLPRTDRSTQPEGPNVQVEGKEAQTPDPKVVAKWMGFVEASNAKGTKNWIGKLEGNGGYHVIIHVPGTSNLSLPIEMAIFVHGAGNWGTDAAWEMLANESKKMGEAGRNFFTVFMQIKGATSTYMSGEGSSMGIMAEQVQHVLESEINSGNGINITFKSICAFSIGGRVIGRASRDPEGLLRLKPNKITLADVVGNDDPYNGVWDNYVTKAPHRVEYNMLGHTLKGANETEKAKQVWQKALEFNPKIAGEGLSESSSKDWDPAKGTRTLITQGPSNLSHYITSAKLGLGHTPYGLQSFSWVNPAFSLNTTPRAAGLAATGKLDKVVIIGTSMVGGDGDGNGGMARALWYPERKEGSKGILSDLGAREVIAHGVGGSVLRQWLGGKFAAKKTRANDMGLSITKAAEYKPNVFFVALGGNDRSTSVEKFLDYSRQVMNTLSPDKSIPVVWMGHTHTHTAAEPQKIRERYRALDETLSAEYPNLIMIYPKTQQLVDIYVNDGGSWHPKVGTHRKFFDANLNTITTFLGLNVSPPSQPGTGADSTPAPVETAPTSTQKEGTQKKPAPPPVGDPGSQAPRGDTPDRWDGVSGGASSSNVNSDGQPVDPGNDPNVNGCDPNVESCVPPTCDPNTTSCPPGTGQSCGLEGIDVNPEYCDLVESPVPNKESRVRFTKFGQLTKKDSRTVSVSSIGGRDCKLHVLAAKRLDLLNKAWQAETAKEKIELVSGLRAPPNQRWAVLKGPKGQKFPRVKAKLAENPSASLKELFDLMLIDKYGSVKQGRVFMAWNSPHQTGLAMDFGNLGMSANSNRIDQMKQEPFFHWLQRNAHKFGITPYNKEPWHWEVNMPLAAWKSGEDWVEGENFAVRVKGDGTQGAVSAQDGISTTGGAVGAGCPTGITTLNTVGTSTTPGSPYQQPNIDISSDDVASLGPWAKVVAEASSSRKGALEYQITNEDVTWACRMVAYEGGDHPEETIKVLWCMAQRFAYVRSWKTLTELFRKFSQPINPIWRRDGSMCRQGGKWHGGSACVESKLKRRDFAQGPEANFAYLKGKYPGAMQAVIHWARGGAANNVPLAANFAVERLCQKAINKDPQRVKLVSGPRGKNWHITSPASYNKNANSVKMVSATGEATPAVSGDSAPPANSDSANSDTYSSTPPPAQPPSSPPPGSSQPDNSDYDCDPNVESCDPNF